VVVSALDQLKMSFVLGDKIIEVYPAEEVDEAVENLESNLELLESALAQRDKRIAELELDVRQFHAAFKSARAEVPEWCQHIVRFVHATDQGRWRDVLTKDRLRACGIDVP